jgi:hypothetical protein
LLRLLAIIFGALGLAALGLDLSETMGSDRGFQMRAIGEYWFRIDPNTLQLAQPAIERHVTPLLWDPVIQTVLTWPAAVVLFVLAVLLAGVSWRRRRRRELRQRDVFGRR